MWSQASSDKSFLICADVVTKSVELMDDLMPRLIRDGQDSDREQIEMYSAITDDLHRLKSQLVRQESRLRRQQEAWDLYLLQRRAPYFENISRRPLLCRIHDGSVPLGVAGNGNYCNWRRRSVKPRSSVWAAFGRDARRSQTSRVHYADHGYWSYWALCGLQQGSSTLFGDAGDGTMEELRSVEEGREQLF